MNPEKMSKDQNKKEFARFVEDYNTGRFYTFFFYIKLPSLITVPTYSYSPPRKVLQYGDL